MKKIIKTATMILVALSIVVLFALISPKNQTIETDKQVVTEYNTQYALQNLIKTYEVNEDSGIELPDDRKVDYCEIK